MNRVIVMILALFCWGTGACVCAGEGVVQVGLDRIDRGEVTVLRDKRVGLIVHAASVTQDGRHAIDVLRDRGVEVLRLFAPEHGLRGRAEAGQKIESAIDSITGLPVISLYGSNRKPKQDDLAGLDALVFDLQGAGVRFYTYVSTLILSLEAVAEAGIELVVLDRPNPLGGDRIEGPVSAPREVVAHSFVNMAPGPLVHGLTLGEMARFVNSTLENPARIVVVPMAGWTRNMVWNDTGREWTPPSPNLRTAEAAMAYPGTAMLEATNVSEGRGTAAPFLMLGAPWMDPNLLKIVALGYELEPTSFATESSPAARYPKYLGEHCRGVRVRVTDAALAEPYRLGLELVSKLSRQPGFEWKNSGANLTRLLGNHRVFEALADGMTVQEILALDIDDHEAWRKAREVALLYE